MSALVLRFLRQALCVIAILSVFWQSAAHLAQAHDLSLNVAYSGMLVNEAGDSTDSAPKPHSVPALECGAHGCTSLPAAFTHVSIPVTPPDVPDGRLATLHASIPPRLDRPPRT